MLTYDVTEITVCIPLTFQQFENLEKLDYLKTVMPALAKLGAEDIEYNGHFGANVYLSVSSVDEMPAILEKLEALVQGGSDADQE